MKFFYTKVTNWHQRLKYVKTEKPFHTVKCMIILFGTYTMHVSRGTLVNFSKKDKDCFDFVSVLNAVCA